MQVVCCGGGGGGAWRTCCGAGWQQTVPQKVSQFCLRPRVTTTELSMELSFFCKTISKKGLYKNELELTRSPSAEIAAAGDTISSLLALLKPRSNMTSVKAIVLLKGISQWLRLILLRVAASPVIVQWSRSFEVSKKWMERLLFKQYKSDKLIDFLDAGSN